MNLLRHAFLLTLAAAALSSFPALAQKKVKTETIRPEAPQPAKPRGEILRDISALPEPVRKMREQILAAARTGEPEKVAALIATLKPAPQLSFGGDTPPVDLWKALFPDSEGVEALAILIEILEGPFARIEGGTPQETYVWPYFYALPLDKLTAEQRVELFKLVTAFDWKEMQKFGAYNFYRAGISADGSWQFFVAGD
jgi:hypothetical protein